MGSRGKTAVAVLGLALATAAGCGADADGLGEPGDRTRRTAGNAGQVEVERGMVPPATMPAPPPPATMPPAAPGNATVIIRAEKISATRIVARLIHAEKIEAESAAIADLRRDEGKLWETEGAKADLSFDELRADTIYTKEIKVSVLEAGQVYAKDLKVASGQSTPGKGEEQD